MFSPSASENNRVAQESASRFTPYMETAGKGEDEIVAIPSGAPAGRAERSHPAESQDLGTENSDQPQSRQMRTSGDGFMGGWLNVRGLLRYRRISAGIMETAFDWHFGQLMAHLWVRRTKTTRSNHC